ncbi:unnamed protein product, partial [Discosporangium mesarthrocarpum]
KELALRYVLEDGKLNVCLRNLVEWREFDRRRRFARRDLEGTLGEQDGKESGAVDDALEAFEKGMGLMLRNAWTHVEAIQTTDIPLLVEYITGV